MAIGLQRCLEVSSRPALGGVRGTVGCHPCHHHTCPVARCHTGLSGWCLVGLLKPELSALCPVQKCGKMPACCLVCGNVPWTVRQSCPCVAERGESQRPELGPGACGQMCLTPASRAWLGRLEGPSETEAVVTATVADADLGKSPSAAPAPWCSPQGSGSRRLHGCQV